MGVASAHIDRDLAPYVRKSFLKQYKKGLMYFSDYSKKTWDEFERKYKDYLTTASIDADWNIFKDNNPTAYIFALNQLEEEGLQSAQALYHNLGTLESRAGSQIPFTSINFGLDTSFEGRKVSQWLMNASLDGIGKTHRTPIFPISIFQYKKDINDRPGTPNYDIKKLAIKSLTKRIYPNFVNCDYVSNVPDIHPSLLVVDSVCQSLDDKVNLRIDSNTGKDNQTEAFDTYDHTKQQFISNYCTMTLGELVESIPPVYVSEPDANGSQIIDLRFTPSRYLIEDTSQKYNHYNIDRDDHYTKINYLLVTRDEGSVSITTESFSYDVLVGPSKEENGVTIMSKHHIDIPKPKYDPDTEMATMGSCDADAIVTYSINGLICTEPFGHMWDQMRKTFKKVNSWRNSQYIETPNVQIYDSFAGDFVDVKRIIRNEDIGVWNKVEFSGGLAMWLTDDHPLPTQRGRIYVKNMKVGDTVPVANSDERIAVEKITHVGFRNRFGYDVETTSDHFDVDGINSHNCRTLIGYDVNGMGYKKVGRGNVTPVTINLARIGIKHGICLGEREVPDVDGFFEELHYLLGLAEKELVQRFYYICKQSTKAGVFMYDNGSIAHAKDALEKGIYEAMKHGTNAFGYVGLANACYAMYGKYPHTDKDVEKFALRIVESIKKYTEDFTMRTHLNASPYSTPAESTVYTLAKKLQQEFGKIEGVCDREYITNSHHIPVYEHVSVKDKIDFESKFCWMSTAGCITYIELNSGTMKNPKAIESIIDYAMDHEELPYFAINFPIDTCNDCGYSGDIEKECPVCGSEDIIRLRRVTGLVER